MLASRSDRNLQDGMLVKISWAHFKRFNAAKSRPFCKDVVTPRCLTDVWPTGRCTPRLAPLVRNGAKDIPPFLFDEFGKNWEIGEVAIKSPQL